MYSLKSLVFLFAFCSLSFAWTTDNPQYSDEDDYSYPAELFSSQQASPRILEPLINETLEKVRKYLEKLDPLDVETIKLTIPGGELKLDKLHVHGLSGYRLENLRIDGLITYWFQVDVVVPEAQISVQNYSVQTEHLYGNGRINYELKDVKYSIKFKLHPVLHVVTDCDVKPSIGSAKFEITGLYNDEKLSKEISDAISHFLNVTLNNDKELHKLMGKILEKTLQVILNGLKK